MSHAAQAGGPAPDLGVPQAGVPQAGAPQTGTPQPGTPQTGIPQPVMPPAAAAPVPLRRNSGFRMLWIGQLLSDTGSTAGTIAYPLLILALTHSAALAGVVGTVTATVQLTLGLPGGALADRLDRRRAMIACDTIRAAALALLGVLVLLHTVNWLVVLAVAIVDRAGSVIFDPAANAALPGIVADQQLEEAWAATEGRSYAASLAGPAIGGVLYGLGRAIPFLGDAASYLVSAGPSAGSAAGSAPSRRLNGPACGGRPLRASRSSGAIRCCVPWSRRRR